MAELAMTTGRRTIKNGDKFNHLFPKPRKTDPILLKDGNTDQTVKLMAKISNDHKSETSRIAPYLKGRTTEETAVNIWNFLHDYIQYEEDKSGVEQLRSPARLWADRKGDCDCMSIFASSVLKNLNIKHRYRVTKYSGLGDWQHVYIIIPTANGKYYTIDGVIGAANTEKSFYKNKDYNDMDGLPIQFLDGLNGISGADEVKEFLNKFKARLLDDPQGIETVIHPNDALLFVDHLLKNYNDTHSRINALQEVIELEKQIPGLTLFQTIALYYDGKASIEDIYNNCYYVQTGKRKFRNKNKGIGALDGGCGKNVAAQGLMLPVRNAFLVLVRLNFMNMASALAPAFFPRPLKPGETNPNIKHYWHSSNDAPWNDKSATIDHTPWINEWNKIGFTYAKRANMLRALYGSKYGTSEGYSCSNTDSDDWKTSLLWLWRKRFGGNWIDLKRAIIKGAEKNVLKGVKHLTGYSFYAYIDDWSRVPKAPNTSPLQGIGSFELDDKEQLGELGFVVTTAMVTAAAVAIKYLFPIIKDAIKKNTGMSDECSDLVAYYAVNLEIPTGDDKDKIIACGKETGEDYIKQLKENKNGDGGGGNNNNNNNNNGSSGITEWIKQNPLPSAAIGLGTGLLIFLGIRKAR